LLHHAGGSRPGKNAKRYPFRVVFARFFQWWLRSMLASEIRQPIRSLGAFLFERDTLVATSNNTGFRRFF
jgi:hypothetical protein